MIHLSSTSKTSLKSEDVYAFSAQTYGAERFFNNSHRVRYLHDSLQELAEQYGWELHAWSLSPNEYSFIASAVEGKAGNRHRFVKHLQRSTERFANVLDNRRGRKVWRHGECEPVSEWASYEHCVKDVHCMPVTKGLVPRPEQYQWSSARHYA